MKKFFVTMSVLGLLSLLISCGDIADSSADKAAPNGKARVSFSLGQIANRVIDPLNITAEDISHLELTAQKLSDEDYEPYKFGENGSLSWESISKMKEDSVILDFGTYNFTLKLFTLKDDEETEFVVQTAKLEAQTVDSSTKTLEFNAEYKDSGDVKITVSWNLLEDAKTDPCRINKIESAFYTIDSFGKDLADGIEKQAFDISTNDETDKEVLKIASASYTEVPNGSYIIKLFLYNSATATEPFDTITDIIKVNGYKTLYDLKLDPNELNVQYEAVFDPNGGRWGDGTTGAKTVLRNAYSGFIPPEEEVTNDELGLVGWYTFPDDRIPENPEELGISGGTSYERIAREDYAQDYKFFAIWGKKTGGKLIKDNRALIIKTDIVDGKLYQNSKINLSVTDSNGKTVTDAIKYDAKILYKGKDINGLTVDGCPYYQTEGKEIFLRGLNNPLPKEKYQLYVTASRDSGDCQITSSQTFDVKLTDGLATPETQVALYNYDSGSGSGSGSYNYYLTDSGDVGAELGTEDMSSNMNIIAFDAQGDFYTANFDSSASEDYAKVISHKIGEEILLEMKDGDGTDKSYYFRDFAIDLAANKAYAAGINEASLYLFKYPKLISDNSCDGAKYFSINESDFYPSRIAVNNNILYVLGRESEKDKMYVYDVSSDSATKLTPSGVDVTTYITGTIKFSSSATVTDIYAMEGAVYILVSDSSFSDNGFESPVWSSTNKDIYKRGSVIKYVPPATAGEGGTFDYLKKDTKTSVSLANTAITNMALYKTSGYSSFMYSDEKGKNLYPMIGNKHSKQNDDGALINTYFPNVYAIKTAEDSALSSPQKVVAVKPKKLVIADDGIAFYTDTEGFLLFKNTNRVVTIDLAEFVIESVQTTESNFDSELSTYLKSDISLDTLRAGGTYYDWDASVWYFDSSEYKYKNDVSLSGPSSDSMYLSIKEDK